MFNKYLFLAFEILRKNKKSFFLLLFEMVLSSLIFLSLIGKVQMIIESKDIAYTFSNVNAYFVMPYSYLEEKGLNEEVLEKGLKTNLQVGNIDDLLLNLNDTTASAHGYNDAIISLANINIKSGEWFNSKNSKGDFIPIIAIGDTYNLNEYLDFSNAKTGEKIKAKIIGIIEREENIITFDRGGSTEVASLKDFVSKPNFEFIVPFNCKSINSFSHESIYDIEKGISNIVVLDEKIEYKKAYKVLEKYGHVADINRMKSNYLRDFARFMIINSTTLLIFTFISLAGIFGINALQSIENKKRFAIFYMLGLHKKGLVAIEIIRSLSLIVASFVALFLVYLIPAIEQIFLVSNVKINALTFLIVLVYMLAIYFITSFGFIRSLEKCNLIEVYKKELK